MGWLTDETFWTALGGGASGAGIIYGLVKLIEAVSAALNKRRDADREDRRLESDVGDKLYKQMGDTIGALTNEVTDLRKELLGFHREHQKVCDDNAHLRADIRISNADRTSLRKEIAQLRAELKRDYGQMKDDYDAAWRGVVRRGFLEAVQCGYIEVRDGKVSVSEKAASFYNERLPQLKRVYAEMVLRLKRYPTEEEYQWEVEHDKDIQEWLIGDVCPRLGVNRHGCLAIASALVREHDATLLTKLPPPSESHE